jgi:hypothetical protein
MDVKDNISASVAREESVVNSHKPRLLTLET